MFAFLIFCLVLFLVGLALWVAVSVAVLMFVAWLFFTVVKLTIKVVLSLLAPRD